VNSLDKREVGLDTDLSGYAVLKFEEAQSLKFQGVNHFFEFNPLMGFKEILKDTKDPKEVSRLFFYQIVKPLTESAGEFTSSLDSFDLEKASAILFRKNNNELSYE
jgi:hypothetical protein